MQYTRLYSVHPYWWKSQVLHQTLVSGCVCQDHRKQERVQARSTLDLKLMRKDTQSPKQEQSVAPRNGPSSNKNFNKKKLCLAQTREEYRKVAVAEKHNFVGWWQFWSPRSPHIIPALHGFNLPRMNLAETNSCNGKS